MGFTASLSHWLSPLSPQSSRCRSRQRSAGANAAVLGREVLWHCGGVAERLPDGVAFLRR